MTTVRQIKDPRVDELEDVLRLAFERLQNLEAAVVRIVGSLGELDDDVEALVEALLSDDEDAQPEAEQEFQDSLVPGQVTYVDPDNPANEVTVADDEEVESVEEEAERLRQEAASALLAAPVPEPEQPEVPKRPLKSEQVAAADKLEAFLEDANSTGDEAGPMSADEAANSVSGLDEEGVLVDPGREWQGLGDAHDIQRHYDDRGNPVD